MMKVALKIDIDTLVGTRTGVPALAQLLGERGIPASFFAVMGPDNSGKAIKRVFTRRGFLGKMARTNPLKIYGLRTLLYGTLLPAPLTGVANPGPLRRLVHDGHELGLHAWDHVAWHDSLAHWPEEVVAAELERGVEAFADALGSAPRAVAAPGWQATAASLAVQDRLGLAYASDSRGREPFYPAMDGQVFRTLQIPGTLPTVDELVGREGLSEQGAVDALERALRPDRLNVYTGHAEIEGGYLARPFAALLDRLLAAGATFVTLGEVAARTRVAPVCELAPGYVDGRAGTVAVQGPVVRELAQPVAA